MYASIFPSQVKTILEDLLSVNLYIAEILPLNVKQKKQTWGNYKLTFQHFNRIYLIRNLNSH